jgi:Tfp pilus assembly protein PilO
MFQFRRLLTRYRPFILPLSIVLVALCVFLLVIIPVVQQTIQEFQDVSALRDQVGILQQKVTVLNNLDETSLQQNFVLTTSAVPIDKSLPTILSTMEGIGDKTGVTLKSLVIDAPGSLATQAGKLQNTEEKKLGAYTLPFSVTLDGTFDQIKTYLAVSNKVRRLIRAKAFTLNFADDALTTQISFDAFYAPLSSKNDSDTLKQLKNSDFDVLAGLEQYPNMGQLGVSTSPAPIDPSQVKPNPFSL